MKRTNVRTVVASAKRLCRSQTMATPARAMRAAGNHQSSPRVGLHKSPATPTSECVQVRLPPPAATKLAATGYWGGWNIARDVALVPGNGNYSGYVMDGYGGVHPFHPTGDGSVMPPAITTAYWGGWDIARSLWFLPGSATAGYTMDGYGGIHPFGGAPAITGFAYWGGWDIAKLIWGA